MMDDTQHTRLPRWRCHKEVEADKIIDIHTDSNILAHTEWVLASGTTVQVMPGWTARGVPSVGDYMVRYEDGSTSWSPAKAFEAGYTRIP